MPQKGNSFFMAVADQLEGKKYEHLKYRLKVRDHMMEQPEKYKRLIPKEEKWESYLNRIGQSGGEASELQIKAFCRLYNINIMIHERYKNKHVAIKKA
jgi:hypothetical protein